VRILILTPRVPWPPTDGGRVAMARLAESLAHAGAEVEVLSLNPRKHHVDFAGAIDIDTSRIVRPLLRREPFVVARFVSREFAEALVEMQRRFAPDVVQIESPFMLPYARLCQRPVVLRSHNVEFRIWDLLARHERNPLRRFALRRVAASLRAYEVKNLNTPDAIVPISDADADDFRSLGCTRPIHVAPCGVTLPALRDIAPEPNTVGFIGSLDFRPNQEAVRWIVDELWPRVLERMPSARLSIAGSAAPEWIRRLPAYAGRVDDANDFLQRMSVVIAPLFAGGGMRIKVLEAMSVGRPVVATPLGAGGVDVDDLVLAEEPIAFAEAIVRLLRDRESAERMGAAARASVAERYDSDRIGRELLSFYARFARGSR